MWNTSAKRSGKSRLFGGVLGLGLCCAGLPAALSAFQNDDEKEPEQEVVIKRESVTDRPGLTVS
jgi:hypothetical protein